MTLIFNCGIYKITNTTTGGFYIGQSSDLKCRRRTHFNSLCRGVHYSTHLQNAFNKYGKDCFIFTVILYCEPEELTYYEQSLVDLYDPPYNICKECVISAKGVKRTEEMNKRKSEMYKGRIISDESKQKMRDAWKTRLPATEETRNEMSQSQSKRTHSEETKLKMANTRRQYWESEENRERQSKQKKTQWTDTEFRVMMSAAAKNRSNKWG